MRRALADDAWGALFVALSWCIFSCWIVAGCGDSSAPDPADQHEPSEGDVEDIRIELPDVAQVEPVPGDASTDVDDTQSPPARRCPGGSSPHQDTPSTSREHATPIAPNGRLASVELCSDDVHWYVVGTTAGDTLTVDVHTVSTPPPLSLHSVDGTQIAHGGATATGARARVAARGAQTYIRIGPADDAVRYDMSVEVAEPTPCADTPPNAVASDALPATLDTQVPVSVCPSSELWFRIDTSRPGSLSIAMRSLHEDHDLSIAIFNADARTTALATSGASAETVYVSVPAPAEQSAWLVRIRNEGLDTENVTFRARFFAAQDATPLRTTGTAHYQDRVYDERGFTGEIVPLPIRSAPVLVVRVADGEIVGEGITDDIGHFDVTFDGHMDTSYRVHIPSIGMVGDQRVEVRDRSSVGALYTLTSAPFESRPADQAPTHSDLLALRAEAVGGAFNIVDVNVEAFEFIQPYVQEAAPTLTYRWQPGRAFPCGSCYRRNVVSLGGQLEDTDEYDDTIILHEFAHFFIEHYSADSSPGGPHRDRRVSPQLAYGEGAAYFFAAMVRDSPILVDNFLDDARVIDIERVVQQGLDDRSFYGTHDGTVFGNHREELVAGIMWDAYDPYNPDEPDDLIEIGVDGHMAIWIDHFGQPRDTDYGPPGIDIVDWLHALACYLDEPELLTPLVEDREFPWDVEEVESCAHKGHANARYELVEVKDTVWLLASDEDAPVPFATVLMDVDDRISKDPLTCDQLPCALVERVSPRALIVVHGVDHHGYVGASWLGPEAARRLLGGVDTVSVETYVMRRYLAHTGEP